MTRWYSPITGVVDTLAAWIATWAVYRAVVQEVISAAIWIFHGLFSIQLS